MERCPGCGIDLPDIEGSVHAYMAVSPACWDMFNKSMVLHYEQAAYWPSHQTLVDAYALQHSPGPDARARQSTAVHIAALCARIENGATDRQLIRLRKSLAHADFVELVPPPPTTWITDVSISDVASHAADVTAYAHTVWHDWSVHHDQARKWVAQGLA